MDTCIRERDRVRDRYSVSGACYCCATDDPDVTVQSGATALTTLSWPSSSRVPWHYLAFEHPEAEVGVQVVSRSGQQAYDQQTVCLCGHEPAVFRVEDLVACTHLDSERVQVDCSAGR